MKKLLIANAALALTIGALTLFLLKNTVIVHGLSHSIGITVL